MEPDESLKAGGEQLDRVLSFFPRIEAKASALFAIDLGLLGLMALNLHLEDFGLWYIALPAVLSLGGILASLYFVYKCQFPHLDGGTSSLIYFREIAKRTEANFAAEFLSQSEEARLRDVLGQVWRNSEILKIKFDSLKVAFIVTGATLVPWVAFLVATAAQHHQLPVFK